MTNPKLVSDRNALLRIKDGVASFRQNLESDWIDLENHIPACFDRAMSNWVDGMGFVTGFVTSMFQGYALWRCSKTLDELKRNLTQGAQRLIGDKHVFSWDLLSSDEYNQFLDFETIELDDEELEELENEERQPWSQTIAELIVTIQCLEDCLKLITNDNIDGLSEEVDD